MEQRVLKIILLNLKIAAGILLASLLSIVLFSSFKMRSYADDFWKQLGISKQAGSESIGSSFLSGYLQYWGARNALKIAAGDRVAVVKELAAYAKQYVNSEAFKKEYTSHRLSLKPQPPQPAKTAEQFRKEYKDALMESLKAMEGFQKSGNADLKKAADKAMPDLQKQIKDADDPNNKMAKTQGEYDKMRFDQETKRYEENMQKWATETPENPKQLIKSRLQQFLSTTADVDFNAELREKSGKKFFVNPDYERKSTEWKQAFRAGKDAVGAARTFAEQWVKELN